VIEGAYEVLQGFDQAQASREAMRAVPWKAARPKSLPVPRWP
jgi:hypothetical protein